MTAKYFLFDCETGGSRDKDVSLLTLYGLTLDEKLNPLDSIDLYVAPEDGVYRIEAEALEVNNIVLVEHHKRAVKSSMASAAFIKFLLKTESNQKKLVPVGHNVEYDVTFAKKLVGEQWWGAGFTKRTLDTAGIARFLQLGKLIDVPNPTLENLSAYFKIPYINSHTAAGDVHLTLEVLRAMIKLTQQRKD
jgi:DNA polymerase III epsilon subunit-like protein